MKKKNNKPESIADILNQLKNNSPIGVQFDYAKIWEKWETIVGEHLARHTHPVTVKDNVLHIHADSPVWMHKLAYKKWHILKYINSLLDKEPVSDLYLRLTPEENADTPQYDV